MALEITFYRVKIRLTSPMLGTVPVKKDVYTAHIANKAAQFAEKSRRATAKAGLDPDAHPAMASGEPATEAVVNAILETEKDDIQEMEERGWTSFMRDTAGRYLLDYVVKGFLKAAASAVKEYGKGPQAVKQLADKVTKYVFVHEKRIRINEIETPADPLDLDHPMLDIGPNGPMCERPLRAQTAQGPRVTVVRSDAVLAEAELQFHLKVLSGGRISRPLLETLLEYGTMMGLGQWRSGAWGSFELVDLETVDELPARVRNPAPIRPPVKPEAPQVPVEEDAPTGPGKSNKEKGR